VLRAEAQSNDPSWNSPENWPNPILGFFVLDPTGDYHVLPFDARQYERLPGAEGQLGDASVDRFSKASVDSLVSVRSFAELGL
jgi:hypothetical protein